ncbi:hypothetical protein N825_02395 [Skermanella stibiiresistens SB22]|uniref:PepSY domain-containing protein n=1 Tax=Skermanella stibiiresistens SB22 TaxID=1385369 RepID=W9HDC9_9PROT|nr:PepSY domain-containing protein [Skermanella stibiiresistens]EWY42726.1 hypothetical protein N825_02395 [Skermanella stibiiresistens SB22]
MTSKTLLATTALTLALLAGPALAGPKCTSEAKDKWLSEADMKQKIAELGYKDIKTFKTTSGNCYEIYGHDKDGHKAEVYFNPVTAAVVKAEID